MKRSLFASKTRRKISKENRRSASDENLMRRFFSTDPRDLPDGFTVGSMSVPYEPPLETPPLLGPEGLHYQADSLKKKKSKDSKAKERHKPPAPKPSKSSSSPVISRPIAVLAATKLDSAHELSGDVKISSSLRVRRLEWSRKERLQRSCSVDGLDNIGIVEEKKEEEVTSPQTPGIEIRRCSTEIENELKMVSPGYRRVVSYQTEGTRRPKKKSSDQNVQSLYNRSQSKPLNTPSPILKAASSFFGAQRILHEPKSPEHLLEALQSPGVNVNLVDEKTGNAPIHSIVQRKKKDRVDLLLTLLINSDVEIDLQNSRDMTALHMAIEAGCELCARAAIVFGADIDKQGCNQFTPLDLVINSGKLPGIEATLLELGAIGSTEKMARSCDKKKVPRLFSFAQKMRPPKKAERLKADDNISEYMNSKGMNKLYNELEISVVRRLSISATIGGADDAFALVLQQRELALYNRTQPKPKKRVGTAFGLRGGSRILFLDGGGVKGLVQLEVLIQLEERTQCKITDLFDWIVGTSTGGVIALAMVYGKKSLRELRQLYFLLKNRIFMKSRYGFGYSSDVLEEILKQYLNPEMRMSDIKHPKVLIAAVNKATTNLELHFYNNCFGDEFSDARVWKVARYTSAAPMFFNEYDNYVDGGVICNNPTDYGLTAIQNYCRLTDNNIPIAAVVSIGTGVYPAEKIGKVDAQNALFFGKQWLHPGKLIRQTQNLMSLLSNALVESEMVAANSRSRCKEQDIPFFRFSPKFDELIAAGETDNEKLFNMIIRTKLDLKEKAKEFDELVNLFLAVAESSKDLDQDAVLDNKLQASHTITEEEEEEEEEGAREAADGRIDKIEGLKKVLEKEKPKMKEEEPGSPTELEAPQRTNHDGESPAVEKVVEQEASNEPVEGDPITQTCKVNGSVHHTCPVKQGDFSGDFLLSSISSVLGQKLELPRENSAPPTTTTSSEVAYIFAPPISAGLHAEGKSHEAIVRSRGIGDKNQGLKRLSSGGELYIPYRTDTKEVDKSEDEHTEYKRETLV